MDEQAGFRFAGIRVLSGRRAVLLDVDLPAALALPLRRLGDPGNAAPRHRGGGHRGPAAGQQRLGQRRHRARPLLALSAREERYVRRASHMSGEGVARGLTHVLFKAVFRLVSTDVLSAPGPLPLGVSVVDQSIIVFGLVFPRAAQKHRLQMLEHFSKLIKDQAKAGDSKVMS